MSRPAEAGRARALALAAAVLAGSWTAGGARAQDPAGAADGPLPFATAEEALDFLRTAEPVSWHELEEGTNPKKRQVVLERDGVRARAVFRFGYEVMHSATGGFVDSYKSELAAFELSRLLGLPWVPPVVERRLRGKHGAVQLWMEDCETLADHLREDHRDPPGLEGQLQAMHLFDNLIHNTDRNPGNVLIDGAGRIWMIDQTRAFAGAKEPRYTDRIEALDRGLWERLRALSDERIRRAVGRYTRTYTPALLERRRKLIEHLGRRLAAEGESFLYTLERPQP